MIKQHIVFALNAVIFRPWAQLDTIGLVKLNFKAPILSWKCWFPVVVIWQPFHMNIIREISLHVECFLLTERERETFQVCSLILIHYSTNTHTHAQTHFTHTQFYNHYLPFSAALFSPPDHTPCMRSHANRHTEQSASEVKQMFYIRKQQKSLKSSLRSHYSSLFHLCLPLTALFSLFF